MTRRAPLAQQVEWQRRAVQVLAELLDLAARDSLPLMRWTVTDLASLVAAPVAEDATQARADWETWCRAVGAWPVQLPFVGDRQLYALAERVDGVVSVAVLAQLFAGGAR